MAYIPFVLAVVSAVVALALRRTRWAHLALWISRIAYACLVLQAPLYFLAKGGFRVSPPVCEWTFGIALARHSLTNYRHIILFTGFFLLTYAQLPGVSWRLLWSVALTLSMGLLVELVQGISGHGHCRMRDLVPDAVGALLGSAIVWAGARLWQHKTRQRTP